MSAHYDHVADCPGADDNASGVAGVLEAARVLSSSVFDRTLVVACWDQEEPGENGSVAYASRAIETSEHISMAFVLDMIGFASDSPNTQTFPSDLAQVFPEQASQIGANQNRGNFVAFTGNDTASVVLEQLSTQCNALSLPSMTFLAPPDRLYQPWTDYVISDQRTFWLGGFPSVLIGDTAYLRNQHFHCLDGTIDAVSDLDQDFAVKITKATVAAAATSLDDDGL